MRKCPHLIPITLREKEVDIEKTEFNFNSRKTRRQFAFQESSRNGAEGVIFIGSNFENIPQNRGN